MADPDTGPAAVPGTDPGADRPVTIVTGAASGIGVGIAAVLAAEGHRVIRVDLRADADAEVEVEARPSSPARSDDPIRACDLRSTEAIDTLVDGVVAECGRLDGLVNNAAIGPLGTVPATTDEMFDDIMATNVRGPFMMARAVLRHLVPAGAGSIVNIGSGAGHGKPNMAAYAASKAAVHALSASMAYDHFHHGIRVNTVIPGGGGIPTGISLGRFGGSADDYRALPHVGSVAGRPVEPDDVGAVVAFLLSDAAATISGTIVDVGCMAAQGGPMPAAQGGPMPAAQGGPMPAGPAPARHRGPSATGAGAGAR